MQKHETGDVLDRTAQEVVKVAAMPTQFAFERLFTFLDNVGEAVTLLVRALGCALTRRAVWVDSLTYMGVLGVNSLMIVVVTVTFSGMVLSLYSSLLAVRYGAGGYVGGGLGLSIVREMAPVVTAVVVTARAGSAIAAEIGSMKVSEQIDALRSLSIGPIEYLVAPRIVAGVVVFPMLTAFANVSGLVGGYLVAVANRVPGGSFEQSLSQMVTGRDITMGLIKAAVFGLVVTLVCCQQGLRTTGGATGVGRSTTNAVVISIVVIYMVNFFLAMLMFGPGVRT